MAVLFERFFHVLQNFLGVALGQNAERNRADYFVNFFRAVFLQYLPDVLRKPMLKIHGNIAISVIRRLLPVCPRAKRLVNKQQSSEAFAESWLRFLRSRVADAKPFFAHFKKFIIRFYSY